MTNLKNATSFGYRKLNLLIKRYIYQKNSTVSCLHIYLNKKLRNQRNYTKIKKNFSAHLYLISLHECTQNFLYKYIINRVLR